MAAQVSVNTYVRRLWSLRTAGFIVAGAAAGLVAWVVGPRVAVALLVGAGAAGGLLVLTWLRARILAVTTGMARLRSSQQELSSALDRRLQGLEKRLYGELAAVEKRLLAAHGATERQVRVEVSTAEQRLRSATSGDLVALEKRLRNLPHPEVR